jgi:hypothetical protein
MATSILRHKSALIALSGALLIVGTWLDRTAQARFGDKVHPILIADHVYEGNASCGGAECHSADEPWEASGQLIGDEYNIWRDWDPHAHSYKTLESDDSARIAAKLNIDSATQSSRCLSCHAIDAPQAQRGELFDIENAVGCESCHGPAGAWLKPHAEEGWTIAQRGRIGAKGLLDQFGLIDTTNLEARANTCVSCHLRIEEAMVKAGHPPPMFEMYGYNYYVAYGKEAEFYTHWVEPTDRMIDARLWAVGQAAARIAAKAQAEAWTGSDADDLLAVYELGYSIAKKHFGAATVAGLADGNYTATTAAAAAKQLAQDAKSVTKNESHRIIIGSGVTALGSAAFEARGEQAPDAFWDAYYIVTGGEGGDAYFKALDTMADLAKP